jgi:hypothetical protein
MPKKLWNKITSIVLLVPGLILGVPLKLFSFLSAERRTCHQIAAKAYKNIIVEKREWEKPIEINIGSDEDRLNLDQITATLKKYHWQQKASVIMVYAEKGTKFLKNPGFPHTFTKLILDGARLVDGPSAGSGPWIDLYKSEEAPMHLINATSVEAVLDDKLPRKCTHRIYMINPAASLTQES